jgi:hypothetical protein
MSDPYRTDAASALTIATRSKRKEKPATVDETGRAESQ